MACNGEAANRPPVDGSANAPDGMTVRDPMQQPFAATSIWNMPIGSNARFVAANIVPPTERTLDHDDEIIVLTPSAPLVDIHKNTADWDPTKSRCGTSGVLLFSVPMPSDFVVLDPLPSTPNATLAVLLADGRTLKQTEPFARCVANQPGTSDYSFPDQDLYGPGIQGAHGGSRLSTIGGTLRLGELRPNGAPPRHALKLDLFAHENYYNDGQASDCYRWPAEVCDGYWNDSSRAFVYGGKNPALRPGALLALPTSVTVESLGLTSAPAQQLAWTLQNYGAYVVDDTGYSAVAICTEAGPNGNFTDQFASDWGFTIVTHTNTQGLAAAFRVDMAKILAALEIVDNNSPTSVGGGGTPLQPLAPEIAP